MNKYIKHCAFIEALKSIFGPLYDDIHVFFDGPTNITKVYNNGNIIARIDWPSVDENEDINKFALVTFNAYTNYSREDIMTNYINGDYLNKHCAFNEAVKSIFGPLYSNIYVHFDLHLNVTRVYNNGNIIVRIDWPSVDENEDVDKFALATFNSYTNFSRAVIGMEHTRYDWLYKPANINTTPEIDHVIYNGPATIVFWKDGTKTVVKAQDDYDYDPDLGLAMAVVKKTIGLKEFMKHRKPEDEYCPPDQQYSLPTFRAALARLREELESDK